MPESQLANVPMPDILRDAVHFARSLKTHESKRRQLQYIGKVMRNIDAEPILLALKKIQLSHQTKVTAFHDVEEWRDRLIAEGDTGLQALLEKYPEADRQYLRQLIRKAQQDKLNNKSTGAETELFKYLRDLIQD
jgi:ribosome-associated protein